MEHEIFVQLDLWAEAAVVRDHVARLGKRILAVLQCPDHLPEVFGLVLVEAERRAVGGHQGAFADADHGLAIGRIQESVFLDVDHLAGHARDFPCLLPRILSPPP